MEHEYYKVGTKLISLPLACIMTIYSGFNSMKLDKAIKPERTNIFKSLSVLDGNSFKKNNKVNAPKTLRLTKVNTTNK